MGKIILGIVADDFSGGSDAASFLAKQGIKTYLYNGIPAEDYQVDEENIAVVIALKTRTEEKAKAVSESLEAFQWLKNHGATQLYSKYCSTFDSTEEGNIGPIIDGVLEKYDIHYTVLVPALPVNGRIVKDGQLIVNGVPLNETHMRHHPLTPMWDANIANLMEPQGKYPSLKINHEQLELPNEEILSLIEDFGKDKEHFYVIPDYVEEKHAQKIVELFGDLPLLTGGSGLMTELGRKYLHENSQVEFQRSSTNGKAIILAGSCSVATLQQIEEFKKLNKPSFRIDPFQLADGTQTKEMLWEQIQASEEDEILVYSSDKPENVKEAQKAGREKVSELLEQTTAFLAKNAVSNGYNRIIVAGGETSGAVTKTLGYNSYLVGDSIDPGVPIMVPTQNKDIRLVLKSGNFGDKDFFIKAANMTKGDSID
ncbi:four-carbon acid sugar kinase family protein [Ornithinibacillus sp. BX22]|uniref:3-oxo-tetronate kinase n=2 Tax=Ornithinibacillus TaxID=484508 RepID=A0A923RIL1_9BACI|nr:MULTISPECIES: 3-oxo-tetronate kinase [Ornithinibacillus]MBC5635767.1 four-carbon acid sugar kinase family protein [Ornithinibacillus hominis]MBS3679377.1 four-carbon acid sugar kinase family protein [Ornithinibacillus massiliensis]